MLSSSENRSNRKRGRHRRRPTVKYPVRPRGFARSTDLRASENRGPRSVEGIPPESDPDPARSARLETARSLLRHAPVRKSMPPARVAPSAASATPLGSRPNQSSSRHLGWPCRQRRAQASIGHGPRDNPLNRERGRSPTPSQDLRPRQPARDRRTRRRRRGEAKQ